MIVNHVDDYKWTQSSEVFSETKKVIFNTKYDIPYWSGLMIGNFFISRKGKHCFEVKWSNEANHVLLKFDWKAKTDDILKLWEIGRNQALFHKRIRSSSGKTGTDYLVLSI